MQNYIVNLIADKPVQISAAIVGGVISFLFGDFDGLLYALVAFVVVDYITGIMVAVKNKTLSSSVGFIGIARKAIIFAIVAMAHIIDAQVIKSGETLQTAVTLFYLANEGISILENAANMGVVTNQKLLDILKQLKNQNDNNNNNNNNQEEK